MNEPLVIARALHLASTLLLGGTIMFRCFVAVPAFGAKAGDTLSLTVHLTRITWAALVVAMLSGAAWLILLAAEIGGTSAIDALSQGLAWIVLTQTAFGMTGCCASGWRRCSRYSCCCVSQATMSSLRPT